MRIVFFDLETGGLDPLVHPIIQIAAVAVDEELNPIGEFEAKVKFDLGTADQEALVGNSYATDVWAEKAVEPFAACQAFSVFLKKYADVELISKRTGRPYNVAQLAGHNAATFDWLFLKRMYEKCDAFLPASYRVLCTLQRAMFVVLENGWTPLESYKLSDLCKRFSVTLDNAHDALADVRATVGLYKQLRINARFK